MVREFLEAQVEAQLALQVRWRQPPATLRELLLRHYRDSVAVALRRRASGLANPQERQRFLAEERQLEEERERRGELDEAAMQAAWAGSGLGAELGQVQFDGAVRLTVSATGMHSASVRWLYMPLL